MHKTNVMKLWSKELTFWGETGSLRTAAHLAEAVREHRPGNLWATDVHAFYTVPLPHADQI